MTGETRTAIDIEQQKLNSIAGELEELQSTKNNGRGITMIRDVVSLLRRGKHHEAKARAWIDADKLEAHEDIMNFIRDQLFDGNANWMTDLID
jgi:hypothetical protein